MNVLHKLFQVIMFLPAGWIAYLIWTQQLGADPAKFLNHKLGLIGVSFLYANLAIGNLLVISRAYPSGLNPFIQFFNRHRRWLGVIGFIYSIGHFTMYLLIESLDLGVAFKQIFNKPYLSFGFLAFFLLGLLAATSNNISVRKLGKRWKHVHRLAYLIFVLTLIHVLLIEKADLMFYAWITYPVVILYLIRGIIFLKIITSTKSSS